MANLQVKNIPEDLHERLRRYALERHRTLSEVVLMALERELALHAWQERLAHRATTDLSVSSSALLEEERHERERALS